MEKSRARSRPLKCIIDSGLRKCLEGRKASCSLKACARRELDRQSPREGRSADMNILSGGKAAGGLRAGRGKGTAVALCRLAAPPQTLGPVQGPRPPPSCGEWARGLCRLGHRPGTAWEQDGADREAGGQWGKAEAGPRQPCQPVVHSAWPHPSWATITAPIWVPTILSCPQVQSTNKESSVPLLSLVPFPGSWPAPSHTRLCPPLSSPGAAFVIPAPTRPEPEDRCLLKHPFLGKASSAPAGDSSPSTLLSSLCLISRPCSRHTVLGGGQAWSLAHAKGSIRVCK